MGELDFDDIEVPLYTPDASIPIGQTTYTIKDLIDKLDDPNLLITEDNSKLLAITYLDTTYFDDYAQVIVLQDVSNPGIISPNLADIPVSPSNQDIVIPTQTLTFEYTSPNNEELDSVKYSTGTITLDITNQYQSELEYELTLTDIVNLDTGAPMILSGTVPGNSSNQATQDLTNHKTIIVQVPGTGNTNFFSGVFDSTLKVKTGEGVSSTDFIDYTLSITNADFSEIYGWFGDKTINIENQTVDMGFFEDLSENSLSFNAPQVSFYISNGFGVPMGLNMGGISSTNSKGTTVNLSGDITASPQLVRAPSTTQVGTSLSSIIRTNETNSNLRELFAISPTSFNIDLTAGSNYNNANDQDRNFVSSTSEVEVVTEINLPLDVKLEGLSRNFGTGIEAFDFEDADTIRLILTTHNELPLEGSIDMQFLDSDSSVLFEFLDISFIKSPELLSTGRIEEKIVNKDTIKLYRGHGYQELINASILNIVTHITSYKAADDNYVKLFSDYEMTLKVGTQANVKHEL
ncbi:hypothetical protein N7E81_06235 [Reichenbachiella carrageenanivorans]|uniref:Uncharacterized protein n=1 Tax=Reichenbachiella carrageenanivorans TaxID=2979869 RepID=A0ABY6D3G7_9BACT|nr:hypothetical protein [Reichenbachiella carrageenanivorans]UXX80695.1 hypothetical protein N7E81_06235 [Reichenbachiella carrageenanivorans]